MVNVVSPEALTNTPFDISWPEAPAGRPKCFIMNYFGKNMPHNYWVISRIMYDFVDDPYLTKNPVMMYDLGNVLPDGSFLWEPSRHNVTAIRVISFGNKEEDFMRARFIHDEMLWQDSQELARQGYLGSKEDEFFATKGSKDDIKRRSLAVRAAMLSFATDFTQASRIIDGGNQNEI